jgi:hypothetical protein
MGNLKFGFEKQKAWVIRVELIIVSLVYLSWLAMIFYYPRPQGWHEWEAGTFALLAVGYYVIEGLRELRKRRRR